MNPSVTIGLPAFKGKYFREALLCWKRQTFADFEVVVQDDCSPDDLKRIFDETIGDDLRFSYERNERSTSPNFVDNWMKTVEKARGEFFVLGSDDDLYEPEYLAEMLALADRHPSIDVFDAHHDFIGEHGVVRTSEQGPEVESQVEWLHAVVCGKRYAIAQSVMCRTSALRSIGGFVNLPAAWGACDWLTWTRLAKNGVANSRRLLMHWRVDGGNTTSADNPYWTNQKLDAILRARALWSHVAEGLTAGSEGECAKIADIQRQVVNRFVKWTACWIYRQLPWRERWQRLRADVCVGGITWREALACL